MTKCLTATVVAMLLAGCSAPASKPNVGSHEAESTEPTVSAAQVQATEYEVFCSNLLERFNARDFSAFPESLDSKTLARNVLLGVDYPAETKQYMASVFETTFSSKAKNQEQRFSIAESFYPIRTESDRRCVVHSNLSDSGLMLIEFKLTNNSGEVKIVDWYDHVFASLASTAARRSMLGAMSIPSAARTPEEATEPLALMKEFREVRGTDARKMWDVYQKFPKQLQNDPMYLHQMLELVTVGHDLYRPVMEKYLALVPPNDLGLIAYDYFLSEGDLESAIKLIDNIEAGIADDSVFDLLRALAYRMHGEKQSFLSSILHAINHSVVYEDAYWSILDFLVEEKHYGDAIICLDIFEQTFGYVLNREVLSGFPDYDGLLASGEFRQWEKAH